MPPYLRILRISSRLIEFTMSETESAARSHSSGRGYFSAWVSLSSASLPIGTVLSGTFRTVSRHHVRDVRFILCWELRYRQFPNLAHAMGGEDLSILNSGSQLRYGVGQSCVIMPNKGDLNYRFEFF